MNRVLVTGGTGCIGRHVLPELVTRGWEVHAVTSREPGFGSERVVWHQANLFDSGSTETMIRRVRATHLVHLAWHVTPGRWASAPENFAWVEASLSLLRTFAAYGGRRVVTAGSCLEYDWRYGYCSEARTPCVPHTVYGVCKHSLQMLTSAFAEAAGLSSAWARVFFVYGPHEHPDRLVASVVRALLAGHPARCSHGKQVRDYLYVEDVADALVHLLGSDVSGPINIASGTPVTLMEIVKRIGYLVGRDDLIQLGAIPPAPTDVPLVVADVTRLSTALAWRPLHDLGGGLLHTIEWWREQLALSAGEVSAR